MGRFLKIFTELPQEKIAELEGLQGAAINDAKAILADECNVPNVPSPVTVVGDIHGQVCSSFLGRDCRYLAAASGNHPAHPSSWLHPRH